MPSKAVIHHLMLSASNYLTFIKAVLFMHLFITFLATYHFAIAIVSKDQYFIISKMPTNMQYYMVN